METPGARVLTTKQQRLTLSAKKKQQGRVLFASPYETYWPILEEEAEEEFNELLLSTLKPVGKPAVQVDWSILRKVARKERREVRRKMVMESCNDKQEEGEADKLRGCLFLGVNAVTRGLGSSRVSAVLLAKDADPKLLISHILTMCSIQRVPVLVVSGLRNISKTALGFSCLALAIKKEAMDNFQSLREAIALHSGKTPVPEPMPSYQRTLAHESDDEGIKEPPKTECKEVNISADMYKYRKSKKERAFVPGGDVRVSKPSNDFIPMSMGIEEEIVLSGFHYKPLKLKRMPPNPSKMRKKELKKRKK